MHGEEDITLVMSQPPSAVRLLQALQASYDIVMWDY